MVKIMNTNIWKARELQKKLVKRYNHVVLWHGIYAYSDGNIKYAIMIGTGVSTEQFVCYNNLDLVISNDLMSKEYNLGIRKCRGQVCISISIPLEA